MAIAATILAAGSSTRMGKSKALLEFRGQTFLESVLSRLAAAGLRDRMVVLGVDRHKILQKHDLGDVTVVTNTELSAGPIGSVRAALRSVRARSVEADGLLIWPVDLPHVSVATIEALLRAFRAGQGPIVVPEYGGRRGHPVLFGRAMFEELENAPDREGARAVVRADPGRVVAVSVADPAILDSINTPEAYRALLGSVGLNPSEESGA